MKILLYGLHFAPEPVGIGKVSGEMAAWLAKRGHDVRVVAPAPFYPEWQIMSGYRAGRWAREKRDGMEILRCPIWVPSRVSAARRLLSGASFAISSFVPMLVRGLFWRPDLVWLSVPSLQNVPAALAAARLAHSVSWLHVQDFEVDAAFDLGLMTNERLRKFALGVERRFLRGFDMVSTISRRMMDKLHAKDVSDKRIVFFPNWANLDSIYPLPAPSGFRVKLGISDETLVCLYSGNLARKQGIGIFPDIARRLADRQDIMLVVCGEGVGRAEMEAAAARLPNMRFLPLQPLESLNDLLNLADIQLLPQRADAADLVMPSKLGGMLASGRPVVAGAMPGTELASVVGRCGIVVPPDDAAAMTDAILRLVAEPALRAEMASRSRAEAMENWHKERVLLRFEEELMRCVSARGRTVS